MTEWRNVATVNPLDTTGTATVTVNQLTAAVSTSAATTVANELVITSMASPTTGMSIAQGAGFTSLLNDPVNGLTSEYRSTSLRPSPPRPSPARWRPRVRL